MIPMALEHLRLFRRPNTAATPGGGDGSSLLFQRCAADYHKQKEQSLCLGIRRKCRKTKLCVHNLLVRALSIQGFIIFFICAWQHDTDRLERMARRRSFYARDKDSARQQQHSPEESSEEIAVRLLRRGEEDREVALDISKKEQRDSLRYCGKKL